jgi:hypothetical protein
MTLDIKYRNKDLEPMPGALLAEMFRSGIVVIPEEFEKEKSSGQTVLAEEEKISQGVISTPLVEEKLTDQPLSWLGNFDRRILVVVHDANALHVNDTDFALLGKIIGAVKLSVADIAVVNAARNTLEYEALDKVLPAKVAIYFGVEPVSIGVPFKVPLFQVQAWSHTKFLYAPALSELNAQSQEAVILKKSLWEALKKIFE